VVVVVLAVDSDLALVSSSATTISSV
jgi:hypothetical protein